MQTVSTINLEHEQMLVLDGGRHGRARVLYGATWLTEEGESGDTVLGAGGEYALGRGRAFIEGLGPTQVQIEVDPEHAMTGLVEWLRRALRDARRTIAHLQFGPAA